MADQPFLTMHEYHLSREKGREQVLATLAMVMNPPPPKRPDWYNGNVTLSNGKQSKLIRFADMEREARETGVVEFVQRHLDGQDSIYGGTMRGMAIPNYQITMRTQYAGWETEVKGPARIGEVEHDLMEDILFFRKEACRASDDYSFVALSRHYRAYLASCISLIDAFLNRHVLRATHDGCTLPALTALKEARGLEERIERWLELCTPNTMKDLAKHQEWCHFQVLRQQRNVLIHVAEPFAVYSIKEIATHLNHVRTGIGGLLKILRDFQSRPSLLFIERLRTAPEVKYHSIRLKSGCTRRGGTSPRSDEN